MQTFKNFMQKGTEKLYTIRKSKICYNFRFDIKV